jgi:hypothetical protein
MKTVALRCGVGTAYAAESHASIPDAGEVIPTAASVPTAAKWGLPTAASVPTAAKWGLPTTASMHNTNGGKDASERRLPTAAKTPASGGYQQRRRIKTVDIQQINYFFLESRHDSSKQKIPPKIILALVIKSKPSKI